MRAFPFRMTIASTADEFEQIFALNYRTFVEEIPQHEPNERRMLKDKFHADNTYLICKDGERVIGMISYCDKRPFSLDAKVPGLEAHLPAGHGKLCEVRLLAVEKAYRGTTRVTAELLKAAMRHAIAQGCGMVVMSGTTQQLRMYERVGFKPFHTLVGKEGAYYQPMYISRRELVERAWLQ